MKICLAGHIASGDLAPLLDGGAAGLPVGYEGAPLCGVLIAELVAAGHQVHAVTVDYRMPAGASAVCRTGRNLSFTVIPGRRRAWRPNQWRLGRAVDLFKHERAAIAAVVAETHADVVHAHWTYEFALGALDSGLPHVITAHDSPWQVLRFTRSPYRAVRWCMAQQVLRRARCITAVSPYLVEDSLARVAADVVVVPNPVAGYVLDAVRPPPVAGRPMQWAMVCNGWQRRKNAEAGLQAFARYRQAATAAGGGVGPQLQLFGTDFGPGGPAQAYAQAQGIAEGCVFVGPLPHRDLVRQLAQLDALLHPSLEETFGVVLIEALALGLPVVAGRSSGAVPWVVGADAAGQSDCAVLVDVRSPDAMAAGMRQLAAADRAAMAALAGQRIQSLYSPAAVAAQYVAVYKQAVLKQSGQPALAEVGYG